VSDSPYTVLSVPATASADEIRAAYRALVKRHHPDAPSGSADLFRAVQAAYDVIGHADKRRKYDAVQALLDDAEQVPISDPWGGVTAPSFSHLSFSGLRHSGSAAFSFNISSSVSGGAGAVPFARAVPHSGSAFSSHVVNAAYTQRTIHVQVVITHQQLFNAQHNLLAQFQPGSRYTSGGQTGTITHVSIVDDSMLQAVIVNLDLSIP
jgi:curved DNA-binding protein CbpA